MLFHKRSRKGLDMADVNGYTAARLGDMASSLKRLAQSFTEEMDGQHLTREDGAAALQDGFFTGEFHGVFLSLWG